MRERMGPVSCCRRLVGLLEAAQRLGQTTGYPDEAEGGQSDHGFLALVLGDCDLPALAQADHFGVACPRDLQAHTMPEDGIERIQLPMLGIVLGELSRLLRSRLEDIAAGDQACERPPDRLGIFTMERHALLGNLGSLRQDQDVKPLQSIGQFPDDRLALVQLKLRSRLAVQDNLVGLVHQLL